MQHDPDSDKFASADRPVNRRTAKPVLPVTDSDMSPLVLARLKAADARQRLGPRLATHLELDQKNRPTNVGTHTALVLPAIATTLSLVGTLLGAINGQALLAGMAGVGATASLTWGYVTHRRQRIRIANNSRMHIELVSTAELNALDSTLEQLAGTSDELLMEQAKLLKDTVARSLIAFQKAPQGVTSPEDQLFLREAVRRYIPDSVNAWLQVNAADRNALQLENGSTANEVLAGQLKTLDDALRTREQRVASALSEALMQQQRFLEAKTGKSR